MDPPYSRFASYDFDSDARFQEGLKKLSYKGLLELKIFYYNRFIEPIELIGFQQWQHRQRDLHTQAPGGDEVATDTSGAKDDSKQRDEMPGSEKHTQLDLETKSAHGDSLSFAEVFRMIQAGEEIPGLQKLDIKPSNQEPSVSQMSRKLKPWEK